jgi:hypothetical protein
MLCVGYLLMFMVLAVLVLFSLFGNTRTKVSVTEIDVDAPFEMPDITLFGLIGAKIYCSKASARARCTEPGLGAQAFSNYLALLSIFDSHFIFVWQLPTIIDRKQCDAYSVNTIA